MARSSARRVRVRNWLIGGVAVASVFTLLVIPVAYSLMDRKRFGATRIGEPARDGAGA